MALVMLLGAMSILPVSAEENSPEVWDGSVATSFAGGDGSESNPYQISNGAELAHLADLVTNKKDGNYNRAHYVLTKDIVLNDMPDVSTWYEDWKNEVSGAYVPNNTMTPIGTWSTTTSSFGGTFDGQGHTISGAYFYAESGDNHGLFGAIQGGAVIKNFALVNSLFGNEGGNIAAIAGTTDRSSEEDILIENIYVDAYVYSGSANAGGILGTLSNSNSDYAAGTVTISRVTFKGVVEGKDYVAGLIADARNVIFDVDDCLVYAKKIRANNGEFAAGFVTRSRNNLDLIDKYDQTVTNCIVVGDKGAISASKSEKYRAFIATKGKDKNSSNKDYYAEKPPLAEYCYNAVPGLATMRFADTTDDAPSADVLLTELYGSYAGSTKVNWSLLTEWVRPDRDIARPRGVAENFEIYPYVALEKGSGTEEDPYLIESAEDLATFSKLSQNDTFEGKFIKLTTDITLEGENNHSPIANWSCGFGGTFDGDGHTISGVHIKNSGDGSGFFAAVQGGATIKNLALIDAYVESTGKGCVGALVGQTNRANGADVTISNVYVDADVIVANGGEVAGIIGNLSESINGYVSGNVNISDVVFDGTVIVKGNYVAGIVGNARSVTVNLERCMNYGAISAEGNGVAGLIVGASGSYTITNCISAGSVSGSSYTYAIAYSSTKKGADGVRSIKSSYYVGGVAQDSIVIDADEGFEVALIEKKSQLMGLEAIDIEGWSKRANDFIVPEGVAEFAPQRDVVEYTVTWQNYDGTVLDVESYEYGSVPQYKGETPTKPDDDRYKFIFNGWTPYVAMITEDVTFVASFYRERKPEPVVPDDSETEDVESETESKVDTETEDVEIDTEINTEINTDTEIDTNVSVDTEIDTEVDTDVEIDTETEIDIDTEEESEPESSTEAEAPESDTEQGDVEEKSFFGKIFDAIFNFFKGIIDAIFGKKE